MEAEIGDSSASAGISDSPCEQSLQTPHEPV